MQRAARDTPQCDSRLRRARDARHASIQRGICHETKRQQQHGGENNPVHARCSMQHATQANMQHATRKTDRRQQMHIGSMQHAALQRVTSTCNRHHATCKTDSMQQTALQYVVAICNMQHCNTQQCKGSVQLAAWHHGSMKHGSRCIHHRTPVCLRCA